MENFVRSHEAVQVACSAILPSVKKVVEDWHQRMVKSLKPCATPRTCPATGRPTVRKGSCQECVNWGLEIEKVYHPPQKVKPIQWANINPTLLCKDSVEVAKAFVLRLPQGHVYKDFGDFDVASILMIMMHFSDFHRGDQTMYTNIQKVSAIRNNLSHMKIDDNFLLDEPTMTQNLCEVTDLIRALHPDHLSIQRVHELEAQIKQIGSSPITSSMQSAALRPLTEAMKQIVRQTIQEMVHKDVVLQRSIDSEPLDVELCRRQLKEHYLQILCKIPQYPGDTETCLDMDEIFTNVSILHDIAKPCRPIQIPLPTHHEIFSTEVNGMLPNRILVLGRGGSGKSTVLAKIAYDWATQARDSSLKELPLLFVLNMRWMEEDSNLEDAIFHQLLPKDTQISKVTLIKYMKGNPSDFIVLLDSYDEFSRRDNLCSAESWNIVEILSNNYLTSSRVLVTTRHWRASDFDSLQRLYAKFEIKGFSEENLNGYITRIFFDNQEDGRRLCEYITANNLHGIASFPLMAQLFCLLWKDTGGQDLPTKIGELYTSIVTMLHKQYISKDTPSEAIKLKNLVVRLGEIACLGLWPPENRLAFTYNEAMEITSAECLDDACKIGIISIEKASSATKRATDFRRSREKDKSIVFFHTTGQEKCAGEFMAQLVNEDRDSFVEKLGKLDSVITCLRVQMILRFACGVSDAATELILQRLIHIFKSELKDDVICFYDDKLHDANKAKLVQEFIEMCLLCNYESSSAGQFNGLISELFPSGQLQFLGMTPYTSMGIGYFLRSIIDRNMITKIKIIQLPQPGIIPSGNSGILESVYTAAKTKFKTHAKEKIKDLHQQYIEAHKNVPNMDKFTSIVKSDYTYGLICIQQWDHFKTWNSTTEIYLDPILDAVQHTRLDELDLTDVKLSDQGQKLVSTIDLGHLSSLTQLKLKDTGFSIDYMSHMMKSLPQKSPNLKLLDIAGNNASDGGVVSSLAESLPRLVLQSLNIRGMYAPASDMSALARNVPQFGLQLHVLRMRGNDMNDESGKAFATTLPLARQLKQLEMTLRGMSKGVHRKLVMAIGNITKLHDLRVYHSPYPDDLVLHLSEAFFPELSRLTIGAQYEPRQSTLKKLQSALADLKKAEHTSDDKKQLLNSSCWRKLLSSIETKSPKLAKLELYNIFLRKADMEDLMKLCRKTKMAFGSKRRCWPDGLDIPEDVDVDLY